MLALERLAELEAEGDAAKIVAELADYVATLEGDTNNFFALVGTADEKLAELEEAAPFDHTRAFVKAARLARKHEAELRAKLGANMLRDGAAAFSAVNEALAALEAEAPNTLGELVTTASALEADAPNLPALLEAEAPSDRGTASQPTTVKTINDAEPYTELYTLPVFSLVNDHKVYEAVSQMQRGRILKKRVTGSWVVAGARPNEAVYLEDDEVNRMLVRNLLVPALGKGEAGEATEYNLSAIAWRCAGCLFTDKTAQIELAAYSVLGTDKDNPTAKRWRKVTADWRTRQAMRATAPTWGKFCEFAVTIGDKVTGDGTKTVTVVYDHGAQVSTLELYGPVNAKGYELHTLHTGHTGQRSLSQYAYDVAAALVGAYSKEAAAHAKAELVRLRSAKPALTIIDKGDDSEALAAELGII